MENTNDFAVTEVLAIIAITGLGIQQTLEIFDPYITNLIERYQNSRPEKKLPGSLSLADFKKSVVLFLSSLLGLIIVLITKIQLLSYIRPEWGGSVMDIAITALVLGSGTEGANTITKFFGYLKDNQNPEYTRIVGITITPSAPVVEPGETITFQADVTNTPNKAVTYRVLYRQSATITTDEGVYTAPNQPGEDAVMATSVADPTKHAIATVTVQQP